MTTPNFSLLSDLDQKEKEHLEEQGKIKYQTYDIELGIEKIKVCIPMNESEQFEAEVGNLDEVNSYTLFKLAKKFKGFTQDR